MNNWFLLHASLVIACFLILLCNCGPVIKIVMWFIALICHMISHFFGQIYPDMCFVLIVIFNEYFILLCIIGRWHGDSAFIMASYHICVDFNFVKIL